LGDVTVTATDTTYTAGLAMDLNSGAFDLDLSELTAETPVSSDYAPFIDSNGNVSVKGYIGTMVNSAIVASTNVQKAWDNTAKTVTLTATDTTYTSSDFVHDSLTGFVANEHIDWTVNQGSTNIHASNYDGGGTMSLWKMRANASGHVNVEDSDMVSFIGGGATTVSRSDTSMTISSTDTTYSVGDGGLTQNNFTNADHSKLDGIASGATANTGDITRVIAGGDGLSGGGTSGDVTLYHRDTSSQGSINGSANSFIQDITLDTYGHITSMTGVAVSGPLLLSQGAANAPTYSFTGDTDIGMYLLDLSGLSLGQYALIVNNGQTFGVSDATPGSGTSAIYTTSVGTYSSPGGNTMYMEGNYMFQSSSMRDLKDDISSLDSTAALNRINALRPVSFIMKEALIPEDKKPWTTYDVHRGFIAEEVAEVDHQYASWWWQDPDDPLKSRPSPGVPVDGDDADPETYDIADAVPVDWGYRAMMADLVSAVQKLSTKLDAAEARLAALEA